MSSYISYHKKKGNKMRKSSILIRCGIFFTFACSIVQAGHVMVDTTMGDLRIELHVLAAEPFFTEKEVSTDKITEGMLIIGGAKPLAPDAKVHPNHHLVIHLFHAKTGKAITDAKVEMNFQSLDDKGNPLGGSTEVPIVIMQAIGKGAQSTHYGNNMVMPAGLYAVSVVVNGKKLNLKINVSDAQGDSTPTPPGKVILFFMNPNGHPCQMQLSILDGMKEKLIGLATVKYVKTTESGDQETFYKYGIRGLPSLIILDNSGKEIKRFTPGIQDEKTIFSALGNSDK